MSWQEELRKLDEELAAGRLSADDYRVRRDQVLSSAVTQSDPSGATGGQDQPPAPQGQQGTPDDQQPGADSTQVISPVSPPQGVQQPNAESTQIVPDPNFTGDRTQGVQWQAQPPQGQYPHQPGPASPAGGFAQVPPGSPAGGFPQPHQQQQQPWNAPDQDLSPPWGGSEFPPIAHPGSSEWGSTQGPEVFDDKPGKGGKNKVIAIVAAVVLLGGIAFGAYWLWGRGDTSASGGGTAGDPSTSAQTTPAPPPDPLPVAELPGREIPHNDVKTFGDVPDLKYLNDDELTSYQAVDPGEAKIAVRILDNDNQAILLLTKVGNIADATTEAGTLAQIQQNNGASKVDDAPDGIYVTEIDKKDKQPAQVRGHYVSGDVLVRIEVSGDTLTSVRKDFDTVLAAQTEVLPADG